MTTSRRPFPRLSRPCSIRRSDPDWNRRTEQNVQGQEPSLLCASIMEKPVSYAWKAEGALAKPAPSRREVWGRGPWPAWDLSPAESLVSASRSALRLAGIHRPPGPQVHARIRTYDRGGLEGQPAPLQRDNDSWQLTWHTFFRARRDTFQTFNGRCSAGGPAIPRDRAGNVSGGQHGIPSGAR